MFDNVHWITLTSITFIKDWKGREGNTGFQGKARVLPHENAGTCEYLLSWNFILRTFRKVYFLNSHDIHLHWNVGFGEICSGRTLAINSFHGLRACLNVNCHVCILLLMNELEPTPGVMYLGFIGWLFSIT